jgi:hypothetical protein
LEPREEEIDTYQYKDKLYSERKNEWKINLNNLRLFYSLSLTKICNCNDEAQICTKRDFNKKLKQAVRYKCPFKIYKFVQGSPFDIIYRYKDMG